MKYYNIEDELNKIGESPCWAILVVGGRQTGKTYSTLLHCINNKINFCFLKRTNDDIALLCKSASKGAKVNLSPFKNINRDYGTNIKPMYISKGIAGFWNCKVDEKGNDIFEGEPIGYALSLNVGKDVKGFGLSECDYLIFDEFIQQPWERVNRREGEQILDIYVTINADREQRGRKPLLLIGLANATNINNKMFDILDVKNIMAEMCINDSDEKFLKDKGIFLRKLPDNSAFVNDAENSLIYKAMCGTEWFSMAHDNNFAYNDFTNVRKSSIKKAKGVCSVLYKNDMYYIYKKYLGEDKIYTYYMCKSKFTGSENNFYNLSLDNDRVRFYDDYVNIFKNACVNNRMMFSDFSMYDLIVNYKDYFKI